MDKITISFTVEELGILAEAAEHLLPALRGRRLRTLNALRNRFCVEIAAGREEEEEDG